MVYLQIYLSYWGSRPLLSRSGCISIGAGIFVVKVVKEYKKQYSELKDELDETNEILSQTVDVMGIQEAEMKEVIDAREDEIETLKESIRSATFDDVDYTGKFTPNEEFEEMRKRAMRSLEVAKEQRAEKVVKNIFHDDTVVKFDIPLDGSRREISEKMIEGKRTMFSSPFIEERLYF